MLFVLVEMFFTNTRRLAKIGYFYSGFLSRTQVDLQILDRRGQQIFKVPL